MQGWRWDSLTKCLALRHSYGYLKLCTLAWMYRSDPAWAHTLLFNWLWFMDR